MRKILILTLVCISYLHIASAQNIQYSSAFDEPNVGWNKILQLSNGNTFYFHFTLKDGIDVTVYNKSRMAISQKTITSDLWDAKRISVSAVEGIYEINGQPVIFLHQLDKRVPTLYRIKLNPETGVLDGEMAIATLPKYKMGAAWAMAYGGVLPADFYVEKDPASDCYAVVNFNTFAGESEERIEVIHYAVEDGKHKKINTAYYDAQGFKYLNFLGMSVLGNKNVFIAVYGYNNKKVKDPDSRVLVSRLTGGDKNFTHKQLDFSEDFKSTTALLKYNPGTNMLQLFTLTYTTSKRGTNYYLPLMNYIDPESLFIISNKTVTGKMPEEYLERNFNYDKGLSGLPQSMYINPDNSTTIITEEIIQAITRNANTGQIVGAQTTLGCVGVIELDEKGNEKDGRAIIKSQVAPGLIEAFYTDKRSKGIWSYVNSGLKMMPTTAFLSYEYINTGKNQYVFFNDYPENFSKDEEKERKRKMVTGISNTNAICYKLKYAGFDKSYLFGAPTSDKQSTFCYIEAGDYFPKTSTYATLIVERDGRKKQSKIAWINLD